MNGINTLMVETSEKSHHEKTQQKKKKKKKGTYELESGSSPDRICQCLDVGFLASKSVTNKFLLLAILSMIFLLYQPKQTKTDTNRKSSRSLLVLVPGMRKGMHNSKREWSYQIVLLSFIYFPTPALRLCCGNSGSSSFDKQRQRCQQKSKSSGRGMFL